MRKALTSGKRAPAGPRDGSERPGRLNRLCACRCVHLCGGAQDRILIVKDPTVTFTWNINPAPPAKYVQQCAQAAPSYQISHPDGRQWKVDSTALKLNGGVAINLKIYDGSDVYNSAKGRVSWFQDGNSNLAVRHSG